MTPGHVIAGKYRLKERLGIGGMGQVWSVVHTHTDREFAVKIMHPHVGVAPEARTRFTREAKASARINHPNVIDIFDVGELPDGSLFLVMELLDGMPLADAFYAKPPLSVRDFLSIMLDTAHALEAAHRVGVVHRDVKPANIFLHRDRLSGLACGKMVDFGISKFASHNDSVATSTGSVVGSPRYMSPEQTRSAASADSRADLWALGVVMFEALTGEWPHDGDSYSSLVVAIATTPPKSIDVYCPNAPEPLRALVRDCLAPLELRIRSAGEIAMRLVEIIEDGDLALVPIAEPKLHPDGAVTTGSLSIKTPPPRRGAGATDPGAAAVARPAMPSSPELGPVGATPAPMAATPMPIHDEPSADTYRDGTPLVATPRPVAMGSSPALPPPHTPFEGLPAVPNPPAHHGQTMRLPSVVEMAAPAAPLLTQTESTMNMAASQAPTDMLAALPVKRASFGVMGAAIAALAVVGVGVGWALVSVTGEPETSAASSSAAPPSDSASSSRPRVAATGTREAPPPSPKVSPDPSTAPTSSASAAPSPAPSSTATAEAAAPPPPTRPKHTSPPSGGGNKPPPKTIDDLGSGL